jgi:guanylate kinase
MLIVITGPSGVGKTTIIKSLLKAEPGLAYSTSITSRQPRSDEVDGIDYKFISHEEFQAKIENDEFAEWSKVYDKYYGRLKRDLNEQMSNGDVILGIDVQGAKKIQTRYPEGVFIFMLPRSEAALEAQLRGRKTDDETSIKTRLNAALQEIGQADDFKYVVVNDRVDRTVKEVQSIISIEKEKNQER